MNCCLVAPIFAGTRERERESYVDSSQPHLTQNVYTSIMMWFANKFAIWYSCLQSKNDWESKKERRTEISMCVWDQHCDLLHAKMKINSCYFEFHSIAFFHPWIASSYSLSIDVCYSCTLMILLICSFFSSFSLWINAHNG